MRRYPLHMLFLKVLIFGFSGAWLITVVVLSFKYCTEITPVSLLYLAAGFVGVVGVIYGLTVLTDMNDFIREENRGDD